MGGVGVDEGALLVVLFLTFLVLVVNALEVDDAAVDVDDAAAAAVEVEVEVEVERSALRAGVVCGGALGTGDGGALGTGGAIGTGDTAPTEGERTPTEGESAPTEGGSGVHGRRSATRAAT